MTDIYAQHQAAFARVEAHVLLADGERIATVAFKFPADGAGRLYAYLHILGCPMVRGFATGGGYDKRTAAFASACERLRFGEPASVPPPDHDTMLAARIAKVQHAIMSAGGHSWVSAMGKAGLVCLQAV